MARIDNNYFTYRETPTTENGTGTLVDIKGQTLKWNQLVSSASGWVSNNGTLSQSGNTYTYTVTALGDYDYQNRMQRAFPFVIPKGHKMFLSCEFYYPRNTPIFIYMIRAGASGANRSIGGTTVANQWTRISGIQYDTSTEFGYYQLALATIASNGYSVGDSVQVRNPMAIDLTMLFGEGNEPTTVEEFKSLFPLDYYDFNSGSLIPFMGNGIKTAGFNQWDEDWELGAISSSGEPYSSNSSIRGKHLYKCFGGKQYYCKGNYGVYWYDSSQKFISVNYVNNSVITSPTNAQYFRIGFFSSYGTTYRNDACISFSSSRNGEYEPYTSSLLNLPISTYFPSGMNSVPKAYDELMPSKVTQRVGRNLMQNLAWSMISSGVFSANLSNVPPSWDRGGTGVLLSPLYTEESWDSIDRGTYTDKSIHGLVYSNFFTIRVYDSSCTTLEQFTTKITDVPLLYELATPIETAISPELDLTFNIDKGGTEELLPSSLMNGSVDLGSLTWRYESSVGAFMSTDLNTLVKKPSANGNVFNGWTLNYASVSANNIYTKDKSIAINVAGNVFIRDTSFNGDATAFKNSLQGVYLWYETTDSTPTTTPILCDILYRGLIPVSVTVYPLGAGTVEGAGQYRYGETVTLVAESSDGIYRFLRYEDENGDTLSTDSTYSFIAGE